MPAEVAENNDVQWPEGLAERSTSGLRRLVLVVLLVIVSAAFLSVSLIEAKNHRIGTALSVNGVSRRATVNFCDEHPGGFSSYGYYCTVTFALNGGPHTETLASATGAMSTGTSITVVVDRADPTVVELPGAFSTRATFLGMDVGWGIAVMVASVLLLLGAALLIVTVGNSRRVAATSAAPLVFSQVSAVAARTPRRQRFATRWKGMSRLARAILLIGTAWVVGVLTVTGVLTATGHRIGQASLETLSATGPTGMNVGESDELGIPAGALTRTQAGTLSAGLSPAILASDGYEAGELRVWENGNGRGSVELVMDQFDSTTGAHAFADALRARMQSPNGAYGPQSAPATSDSSVPGTIFWFGGTEDPIEVVLAEVESGPYTSVNHVVIIVTARGFEGDAGLGPAVDLASRQFHELWG